MLAEDLAKLSPNVILDNFLYNAALEITIARIEHVEQKTGITIMCENYKNSLHNYVWKTVDVVERDVTGSNTRNTPEV